MKKFIKKIKTPVLLFVGFALLLGFLYYAVTTLKYVGKKSIHEDAKALKSISSVIYYPDSNTGKRYAQMLQNEDLDESFYDYVLIPYGDYYLVKYQNGLQYFCDRSFEELWLHSLTEEGKTIISDYLRCYIKKEHPEKYYKESFFENTLPENINYANTTFKIEDDALLCNVPGYDFSLSIPLKYAQLCFDINLGYEETKYVKPTYLDTSRPYVCLTFEGGPNESSEKIVDVLSKYDATATFFVSGDMLGKSDDFLQTSISRGNEYGSLTQNHIYLTQISDPKKIKEEIDGPIEYFNNKFGYKMNIYRPPGGLRDEEIDKAAGMPAICWSVDSGDWLDIDVQTIVDNVVSGVYNGEVIILHDEYADTAQAMEKIVPEIIKKGFQIVTISDALALEELDYSITAWYGYL